MKISELLNEATVKASAEPFVLSDGTKVTADSISSKAPNLNWRPEVNPFIINRPRTKADDAASKKFLADVEKDLEGYKKYLVDTNQMTPYQKQKESALKNADKVLLACKYFDSIVDTFNALLGRLNKAAETDNIEDFEEAFRELRILVSKSTEASKTVKGHLTLPKVISKARTLAAIGFTYMMKARDNAESHFKRMKMSPAQREAARKASARMKMAWME